MRFSGLVVAILIWFATPAFADFDTQKNRHGDGIEYSGQVPGQPGADHAGATSGAKGSSKPVYLGRQPVLSVGPDGQQCIGTERSAFGSAQEAVAFENGQEARWGLLLAQYGLCPGAELPQADPAVLAEVFWGEVLLPKPVPRIEPGWAMTGRLAYLETQAPMTQTFTRDTPLGPLSITATGEFLVDWGDGTRTGPHADAGAPWPDGRITHGYTTVRTVDVVVTEQWRATWTLGARTGTLTALNTQGTIPDLPVREVQAVRNR
jgi:hypothetical protein